MLSPNAIAVLERRYLQRDSAGKIKETPEELFHRVATVIAAADGRYGANEQEIARTADEFEKIISGLDFVPNSPTLMNAGTKIGQLSACFVLPVEDSLDGIFGAVRNAAKIHQSGGGTGFAFSHLRPAGDPVRSTNGVASGPVSFMHCFDAATGAIKQGGKRRGANMAVLRVDHPDIMEFVHCKQDNDTLNNFNISVAVTDTFMKAVREDGEYDLVNPRTGQKAGSLSAGRVWEAVVEAAWKNGEPGVLFLDEANRRNTVHHLGEIESTNPCGEQFLLSYESCNLGSINLSHFIEANGSRKIDYDRLGETVHTAIHFLDNVIDCNGYPLPEIKQMTLKTRKVGLGVMGFADMLLALNIPYNSEEAIATADEVMSFIQEQSKLASAELARKRGNFPAYDGSVFDGKTPMRNATTTTIAPTGSISIIAGCSSGIEPLFALSFVRRVMDGDQLLEVNPHFEAVARRRGFYSPELMDRIAHTGSIAATEEIPEDVRRVFVTAHDISPEWHVRMQAAFQNHTDNAVSKTVNLPKESTVEDVRRVFDLAFELGCKGVTIYRDGSRDAQVLNISTTRPKAADVAPRPRPDITTGVTERVNTGCGKMYVTVNKDGMGICEVFAQMGKAGGCARAQIEAVSRLVSLSLRSGIKPEAIVRQLLGIRCPASAWQNGDQILSCIDGMAKVLNRQSEANVMQADERRPGVCPECGAEIEHEGGCVVCRACGYSRCA